MVKMRIKLNDTVLHWARIQAAQERTTAPRLIAGILQTEKTQQELYERARQRWLARNTKR